MTKRSKWAIAALAATLLPGATWAQTKCHLNQMLDTPVAMEGLRAVIATQINGQDARFVIDTGAFYSMLTSEAAKRFKVFNLGPSPVRVTGIGGQIEASLGEVKDFNFGGELFKHVQFIVADRNFAPGTVGLLGENVLSRADVEFDLGHGVMRFLRAHDCDNVDIGYWAPGAAGRIPIDPVALNKNISGRAMVNGKPIRVMIDSGAPTSILSRGAAERAGIRIDSPGVTAAGVSGGVGHDVVEIWTAPIASFKLDEEEIKNTRLQIGRIDLGDVDMILGMDFFLSHRILVSRSQNKLYFTYNGGPVFRLDQPPEPGKLKGDPAPDASTAAPDKAPPQDADGLARLGAAQMSRREFEAALISFNQALALDPKNPVRYLDRARAQRAAGHSTQAMGDYDRALELKPGDPKALFERAELYLSSGDVAKAQADFDAALKAAPDDSGLNLRIAEVLERHGRYDLAIVRFDAWIAQHPQDADLWQALGARCDARAWAGVDLGKALDDCNAALRRGPRNSLSLYRRGFVRLRLAQWREAINDFNAALALQPRLPLALYGRGFAERKLGLKAEGDADIAAAAALQPSLPEFAKRHGLGEDKPATPAPAAAQTPPLPQPSGAK